MSAAARKSYRMVRGRFSRIESGVLRKYPVGSVVELTEQEALAMSALVQEIPAEERRAAGPGTFRTTLASAAPVRSQRAPEEEPER